MNGEESAEQGALRARQLVPVIQNTMQLPGMQKDAWWLGFLSVMAGICYIEVGDAAHTVIMGAVQQALRDCTKTEGEVVQ